MIDNGVSFLGICIVGRIVHSVLNHECQVQKDEIETRSCRSVKGVVRKNIVRVDRCTRKGCWSFHLHQSI